MQFIFAILYLNYTHRLSGLYIEIRIILMAVGPHCFYHCADERFDNCLTLLFSDRESYKSAFARH